MTMKFIRKTTKKSHLLSVAFLSTSFFVGGAVAADGSTSIENLKAAPSAVQSITSAPTKQCPLNSGGPSLLGTTWRLDSIYGNRVPFALKIDMRVSTHALAGNAGCNQYSANFKQVGYTGFSVKKITKKKKACKVIIPYKGAKSINVGSWEGSYLRTLKRMGSVRQITNSRLHFFNRNGEVGMKFRKIGDENKEAAEAAKKAALTAKKTTVVKKEVKKETKKVVIEKKVVSGRNLLPVEKNSSDKPVIRKISTSDDNLIEQFFKTVEF